MHSLPVGSILKNRYRVAKILHKSKLTNVYVVDDTHLRGNLWAVKEMKFLAMDSFERQKIIAQFEQEVIKMTEISHPNFARVIDFFVEGANLYIIREFIPAYDIETLMKKNAGLLREKDVLNWGMQLAEVLNFLFNKKFPAIFFRELTLTNILVNSEGSISLIDLGLARVFQTETDPSKLKVMGAMDYASPEQFDENGIFDRRTLVYNLGALLYHVLTGKNPAQSLFNLPAIQELNPEVSVATRKIIEKAVEIEPRLRYQNLTDMKRDMKHALRSPDLKMQVVNPGPTSWFEDNKISYWSCVAAIIIFFLTGGVIFLIYRLFF
ncbi:MAG: serine/threonine protein kinase [Candidatus Eremiobacteraeota bacterium]|nr:serine/threonine protein kinase [Candidatus Eremiobacteraeota bacterium]